MDTTWRNIPEAILAREAARKRLHDVTTSIFVLKRDFDDGKIDADDFDDSRMALNGEARSLEGEVEYIDAWIDDRKRERATGGVVAQAELHRIAEAAKEARAAANRAVQERAIAAKEKRDGEASRRAEAFKALLTDVVSGNAAKIAATVEAIRAAFPGIVEAAERGALGGGIHPPPVRTP